MIFELEKPMYDDFYAIWDKWIIKAKANNYKMVVITRFGTSTYATYKEWTDGAKKLKRPYLRPDDPMIFYGRHIKADVIKRDERKKLEAKQAEQEQTTTEDLKRKAEMITNNDTLRAKLGLKP